jgi:S-adenosylmethionine:tRNA ribosyltransferase-isomerase
MTEKIRPLRLSEFDYYLPKELIAQYPLKERDTARLLILKRKRRTIEHTLFKEIGNYLHSDDLLVLNNTKVLPSRIFGRRLSGGRVELLLLRHKDKLTFDTLIKPSRIKLGERIIFNNGKISGIISGKNEITFNATDINSIAKQGVMPLPIYIKRKAEDLDNIYYQTVYAKEKGALASPTAGLHFTKELLRQIEVSGVNLLYLTLHIGLGTFRPVKIEDITKHKMEPEYFRVPKETPRVLENTRKKNGRVIAVGTTSLRALETYASGRSEGYTDLFIYPGYKFKIVDALLTNFHLPRTTLFILVCAFAGKKLIKKAYQEAIDKKYRFYSYGDAMLIL